MFKNKNQYYTFIVVVSIIVSTVFVGLLVRQEKQLQDNFLELSLQSERVATKATADDISNTLFASVDRLELLALHPDIIEGDATTCKSLLSSALNSAETPVDTISRMNQDGFFDCSTNEDGVGFDGNTLPYLQRILADPGHKMVISDPTPNRLREGSFFIAFHVPIFDEAGGFRGTLGSALYLDEISAEFIEVRKVLDIVEAYIIDDANQIVYSSSEQYGVDIEEATISDGINDIYREGRQTRIPTGMITKDGSFATYAPIQLIDTTWSLVIKSEPSIASLNFGIDSDPVLLSSVVLIGLVVAIAVIVVIYFSEQMFFAPLDDMTRTIKNIAHGEYSARAGMSVEGKNEALSSLAQSVNVMAHKIEQTQDQLKKNLDEKTEKISETERKLRKKIDELETINDSMVGRELKMLELKQKLKELEKNE